MNGLGRPSDRVLQAYRGWFHGHQKDSHKLFGQAKYMLDDKDDLVALKTSVTKDWLSRFLMNHWPTKERCEYGQAGFSTGRYSERQVVFVVNALNTAIAASLLIGPILALYWVTQPTARLALVIIFIATFAAGLGVLTTASRDGIFAATAAYSAVLVVFVSGNLGSGSISPS